jgi:hypothetical protein
MPAQLSGWKTTIRPVEGVENFIALLVQTNGSECVVDGAELTDGLLQLLRGVEAATPH